MPKRKETEEYSVLLNMNGVSFAGSGATIADAFNALGVDFQMIKTKGEITVVKGDRKAVRLIQLPKLRRYFASKLLRSGLIRDFDKLLV